MSTVSTNLGMILAEGSDTVNVTDHVANPLTAIDNTFNSNTPSTQAIGDSAVMGSALVVARSDHKHAMPAFGTPVSVSTSTSSGVSVNIARSDHVHDLGTGVVGTSQIAAGVYGAASALTGSTANGSASTLSRSDHVHGIGTGLITSTMISDGTIVAGDISSTAGIYAGQTDSSVSRRNLLDNGGAEIWQRGAGPFTTNGEYTADRWFLFINGGSSLQVDRESTTVDAGSKYSLKATYTHVASQSGVGQIIEFAEPARGRPVTITARIWCATAGCVNIYADDAVAGLGNSSAHTGGSSWETITLTVTPTSGATAIRVYLFFGNSVSGTAYLDNIRCDWGSYPALYLPELPQVDLARCQRYYYRRTFTAAEQIIGAGLTYSTSQGMFMVVHPVQMRAAPTRNYSALGDFRIAHQSGGAYNLTTLDSSLTSYTATPLTTMLWGVVTTTPFTAGDGALLVSTSSSTWIEFSADL